MGPSDPQVESIGGVDYAKIAGKLREELGKGLPLPFLSFQPIDWTTENQAHAIFTLKDKLYFDFEKQGLYSLDRNFSIRRERDHAIYWAYCHYNGKIWYRDSDTGHICTFDGANYEDVFTASAPPWSLCPWDGWLYVGQVHTAGYWDGSTYTEDTEIRDMAQADYGTDFWWVLNFFTIADTLYAVPSATRKLAARIYRKTSKTAAWERYLGPYPDNYSIAPRWEIRQGAVGFPLNAWNGNVAYLGGNLAEPAAHVWTFDGSKLLSLHEDYYHGFHVSDNYIVLMKPIQLMGYIFALLGVGTSNWGRSKIWVWDQNQLWDLVELPHFARGMDFYNGLLFINWDTVTASGFRPDNSWHGYSNDASFYNNVNFGGIDVIPFDAITKLKHLEPRKRVVWKGYSIDADTTVNSDDDGGLLIPCSGYKSKTVFLNNTESMDWKIQIDPDGSGTYYDLPGASESAVSGFREYRTEHDFAFMRIVVTQGGTAGTLDGWVGLR